MNDKIKNRWRLPCEPYRGPTGPVWWAICDRAIEIPWSVSLVDASMRVLDTGVAYAEDVAIGPVCKLGVKELYGCDWAEPKPIVKEITHNKMKIFKQDLRDRFPDEYQNFFDIVLCISTLEHVGQNNSHWYFKDDKYGLNPTADIDAVINMRDTLKPGGMLAITVPYGAHMELDCFKQYDKAILDNVIEKSGMTPIVKDFFICKYMPNPQQEHDGWYHSTEDEVKNQRFAAHSIVGSTGLACFVLQKDS